MHINHLILHVSYMHFHPMVVSSVDMDAAMGPGIAS